MNPTTVRISDTLDEFLNRTENSITDIAREAVRDRYYDEAAGVCAKCGDIVFTSDGHTTVSITTPLGDAIDPSQPVTEFDLCETCGEKAYDLVSQENPEPFELEYLEANEAYQYDGIRQATADLGSEQGRSGWRGIISNDADADNPLAAAPNRLPDQMLADLLTWASWKETTDSAPSDGLSSPGDFTVRELLTSWDDRSIALMYENVHIADLIEKEVIPETPEEAIKIGENTDSTTS